MKKSKSQNLNHFQLETIEKHAMEKIVGGEGLYIERWRRLHLKNPFRKKTKLLTVISNLSL